MLNYHQCYEKLGKKQSFINQMNRSDRSFLFAMHADILSQF